MTPKWPRVEAVSNPNGDWKVCEEHGGKVIADLSKGSGQHDRLLSSLKDLAGWVEYSLRHYTMGNTTGCRIALERARAVIQDDSGHGCTEVDSATQERNAKRIAHAWNASRHAAPAAGIE